MGPWRGRTWLNIRRSGWLVRNTTSIEVLCACTTNLGNTTGAATRLPAKEAHAPAKRGEKPWEIKRKGSQRVEQRPGTHAHERGASGGSTGPPSSGRELRGTGLQRHSRHQAGEQRPETPPAGGQSAGGARTRRTAGSRMSEGGGGGAYTARQGGGQDATGARSGEEGQRPKTHATAMGGLPQGAVPGHAEESGPSRLRERRLGTLARDRSDDRPEPASEEQLRHRAEVRTGE